MSDLLNVRGLRVVFPARGGEVEAVRGVSFGVARGERLGIVGESGSGKTMTGRAVLKLIRPPGKMRAESVVFDGIDLAHMDDAEMRRIRGRRITMIMQDAKFSLNPVMTAGRQIAESFVRIVGCARREARERALDALRAVRIRDPARVFDLYPHELSGGMGQRVMIAMMLAPSPDLIIADEPTSSLDVTVRLQVLALLDDLTAETGAGVIFISHDLNLVASFCSRVLIMYAGRIVENRCAADLFSARHPYTRGLLAALPAIDAPVARLPMLARDPSWLAERSVAG